MTAPTPPADRQPTRKYAGPPRWLDAAVPVPDADEDEFSEQCANCQTVKPLEGCGFGCSILRAMEARDRDAEEQDAEDAKQRGIDRREAMQER